MIQTKLFKSNRLQALRLPKPVAFPDDVKDVEIISIGNSRIITPINHAWDLWFNEPSAMDDFMQNREQPATQERDDF